MTVIQMETLTKLKKFVHNPHYNEQRQVCLEKLDINTIDTPVVEIVTGFEKLPYCFTLQSCYGHFLHMSKGNGSDKDASKGEKTGN